MFDFARTGTPLLHFPLEMRRTVIRPAGAVLAGLFLLVSGLAAVAQPTSPSKISAHLINAYTAGVSNIVAGHPRVLKILDLGSGMLQAARAYRADTPGGKIVLRIYTTKNYALTDDPAVSATNFWTTVLQPPLNALSPSDRALIDYVEGPNEGESTPTWQSLQAAQWFSSFWQSLSRQIAAAGFKPCIGSIGVGNPPGTPSQVQSYISAFVPALRQAKALGGAWSYHAYTINYTTDAGTEYYYSLRYRQFYSQFATQYPDLNDMPLILTEGGVDQSGDPSGSGWQARGTAADYERWLNWFDRQLGQDTYLLGCTLFQIGNPSGWSSFDLEPIAAWMRTYLTLPTDPPPAPTGLSGFGTNATALLIWTSIPLTPTTYNVKRSRTSGGPYATIATGITEGVRATTYADPAVTNGGTYYYVISAVNTAGEGPNSAQVAVTVTGTSMSDVIVTAVTWLPRPAFTGSNVTFRATVRNQGLGPTPAGVVLGIGFSVDGGPNIVWSGSYTASLAPGASVTLSADGGISRSTWPATAGLHNLTATVDDINRFPESNDSNNGLTVSLPISSGPPRMGSVVATTNGLINFSFTATPAITYRVLYKGNLNDAQWQALSPDIVANSTSVAVSDSATNAPQRFYRAQQVNW